MAGLILKRPSPYSFPGGQPGFDPTHPVSKGTVVSAVSVGANFINLLNGKAGTANSAPPAFLGPGGPGTKFTSNTNVTFPIPVVTPTAITMAAIFEWDSTTGNATQQILTTGASAGQQLAFNNPCNFGYAANGGAFITALFPATFVAPIAGVTYFYAVSMSGSAVNCVQVRLDTGAMSQITQVGSVITVTDAFLYIGNRGLNSRQLQGGVHAVYYNPNVALSMPQLVAWAKDPWAFWYPKKFDIGMLLAKIAAGGAQTNKTLTATCTSTATLIRSIFKVLPATATSTSTLQRNISKTLTATATSTSTLIRSIAKTLAAACTTSVVGSAIKVILKTLTATCTSSATLIRSIGKPLAATCTSTAALIRRVNKTLTATCTSTATLIRSIAKTITATCTTSVVGTAIKVILKTLTATCTSTSSLITHSTFARTVTATCTSTAALIRSIAKALAATCTSASTLIRTIGKKLLATCTTTLIGIALHGTTYFVNVLATCTTSGLVSTIKTLAGSVASLAAKLRPYKPLPPPVIPGNDVLFLLNELQKVSNAFNAHVQATKDIDARLKAAGF